MTFKKMLRVLQILDCNGWIGTSTGGELELIPSGQLQSSAHRWLLRIGFVAVGTAYIYRPRRK
jgi:hypothetical protein